MKNVIYVVGFITVLGFFLFGVYTALPQEIKEKIIPFKLGTSYISPVLATQGINPPSQGKSSTSTEWLTSEFGGAGSVSSTPMGILGLESITLNFIIAPSTTTSTAQFVIQYSDDDTPTTDNNFSGWFYENIKATTSQGYATTTYYTKERLPKNIIADGTPCLTVATCANPNNSTTTISVIPVDGSHKWARFLWRYLKTGTSDRGWGGRIYVKYIGKEEIVR